jgi:hypothetical protein
MWIVIILLVLALLVGVVLVLSANRPGVQGDPDLGRRRGEDLP